MRRGLGIAEFVASLGYDYLNQRLRRPARLSRVVDSCGRRSATDSTAPGWSRCKSLASGLERLLPTRAARLENGRQVESRPAGLTNQRKLVKLTSGHRTTIVVVINRPSPSAAAASMSSSLVSALVAGEFQTKIFRFQAPPL